MLLFEFTGFSTLERLIVRMYCGSFLFLEKKRKTEERFVLQNNSKQNVTYITCECVHK